MKGVSEDRRVKERMRDLPNLQKIANGKKEEPIKRTDE